jgi:ABC-type uncharacterized transport system involved in gliding motility auxiliary subunit
VQRGGRVLFLLDRTVVDLLEPSTAPVRTGLEELLRRWGAPVGEGFVWDQGRSNTISTYETANIAGEERRIGQVRIEYPLWPNVGDDGLETSLPVVAAVPGMDLFWAHEIEPSEIVPRHAARQSLVRSSASSWIVDPAEALVLDPAELDRRAATLLAGEPGRPRDLAVSISGRLPSPFVDGAPAPLDDVAEALWLEAVAAALEEGREPPPREVATTDEAVRSEEVASQVVVVGDADWVSSGKLFTPNNRMLLENLIDWLALEDDLISLRSRMPVDREIDDFLEEERQARGLVLPSLEDEEGRERYSRLETEAAGAAARRRWMHMAGATGGSLGIAIFLGLLWRLVAGGPRGGAR